LFLLLGILASGASAETFRCRDAEGGMVFTDDPAKFPPGCKPIKENKGDVRGGLTIIPTSPAPVVRGGYGERSAPTGEGGSETRDWRKEAQILAEEYQKAQAQRIPTLPPPTVYKAVVDMKRIVQQAAELRREMAGERLPAGDRAEIEQILSVIPPPP